jgi:hypothetical protein
MPVMNNNKILESLQSLLHGRASRSEIAEIQESISDGNVAIATGERSVAIGGNANGAVIQVGDINISLTPDILQILMQPQHPPTLFVDVDEIQQPGEIPFGSNLKFLRNEVFTGREDDLKNLAKVAFDKNRSSFVVQIISGLGGTGKTQLAVEFGVGA